MENLKSQSILEYIVVMTALVAFIVFATIGLKKGVQFSLNDAQQNMVGQALDEGLTQGQEQVAEDMDKITAGAVIEFDEEGNSLTPLPDVPEGVE